MYTYKEVIERIETSHRFGNLPGVEVTGKALAVLHHPQQGMRYVHVAGTNGKGSVCAFLSSILQKAGKKVGTFTSPHLIHFEERIMVDGRMIGKEDVTRLGNQLLAMDFGVTPTMFDYCLLMAVLYFREQQCDFVVIETGLGGRLDSTNALGTPEVAVITKIGYDHTAILGETLGQIASEKAGILKKGSVLVLERQEREAEEVILAAAEAQDCDVYRVTPREIDQVSRMQLHMLGSHQWENAAAAMIAGTYLLKSDAKCEGYCREGLEAAEWQGRMQILSKSPFLMVDGAHNGHGVLALCESLKLLYPKEKFHFLMGVMADKDYQIMIKEMLPIALNFVTVTPESDRALQAEQLAKDIGKMGIEAVYAKDLKEVLRTLPTDGKTIAFGSLYFVGEVMAALHKIREESA